LGSLKTAPPKTLQSGFINYKSPMKKVIKLMGLLSLLAGVNWIFFNENRVGVGGALIGFGVALSYSKIK
jgi:hypothetical protein